MENLGNLAQSTLHTTVISSDLSWVVDNPSSGPQFPPPNFRVRAGTALTGEIILVTAVSANTPVAGQQTWTVSRAQEGTTAQGWSSSSVLQHVLTKTGLDTYLKFTPTATQTSAYTAVIGDWVMIDSSAGGFTVLLPTAAGQLGRQIRFGKVSTDYNVMIIAPQFGQTLSGDAEGVSWTDPYVMPVVESNGSNWFLI